MKNNSFARAMDSIVQQAEAERQLELKAQQRAQWFVRIRKASGVFFLATIMIFIFEFYDRTDLVAGVLPSKFTSLLGGASAPASAPGTTPVAKASVALQGAAQNAAVRDQLIDSLSK